MRNCVWRGIGVYVDDGLATLQFFEDGLQQGIAQVHAVGVREQHNAIEPEDVERVRQLFERRIDIWQRDTRKRCKSVWPCVNEFGREFVAPARQSRRLEAISRVHARCTQRQDGDIYPGVIHE